MSSIISRPKSDFYALIGVLAFIGLILVGAGFYAWHDSPRRAPQDLWIGLAATSVLLFLPCAYCLWLMRRLRIVADARGLQIRRAFTTQLIHWRDIEDYELRPPETYGQQTRSSWICAGGKWRRLPQLHDNMDALRARIQTQATGSRARGWQLNVARDEADVWPKTYAYRDPLGKWTFALMVGLVLLYVGLIFGRTTPSTSSGIIRDIWNNLEWWGKLGFAAMPLIGLSVATLLLLPHYAVMRAKKRLGQQTIRANTDALTLIDGDQRTRIAWREITDYYLEDASGLVALPQCAIESPDARVVFRQEITGYTELKALITERAINAASTEWRSRESADSDILGGEPSLWSGGVAGVGRKIYHYRTRTTRAMLMLGGAMLLVLPIRILGLVPLRDGQMPTLPDRMIGLIFVAPVVALTVVGALAFWRASIQTDENGVLHHNIWGERYLRWSEIEAFTFNGYFYQIKGARTTIRYGLVAASESLQGEIETRADLKMRRTDRSESDE